MGVDHRRGAAPQPLDLTVAADAIDAVAAHGHRFGKRRLGDAGVDAPVVDQQIDRAGVVVALGADDEPGHQRHSDDDGDGNGGESGSHGGSGILPPAAALERAGCLRLT